jgi:hypothetical protein
MRIAKFNNPPQNQSTPKLSEVLCDHLLSLRFPSRESISDHPASVIQALATFRLMMLFLIGQADQRLA